MDEQLKKTWIVCAAVLGFVVFFMATGDPYTLEQSIQKAHGEYAKRSMGYQSSFLPREGPTKGDDYKNCVTQKYNRHENAHDFCSWHAGLGATPNLREPREIVEYRDTPEYKSEIICLAVLSIGRDIAEKNGNRDRFKKLTSFQDQIYLRQPTGQFRYKHIDARKFLLKQQISEGEKYLSVELEKCGWKQ